MLNITVIVSANGKKEEKDEESDSGSENGCFPLFD